MSSTRNVSLTDAVKLIREFSRSQTALDNFTGRGSVTKFTRLRVDVWNAGTGILEKLLGRPATISEVDFLLEALGYRQ